MKGSVLEMNKILYENRSEEDKNFMKKVCNDVLSQSLVEKHDSDSFCGIFVEGRNREINTLEDFAAIHSFKLYSQYNYPLFLFINNDNNLLNNNKDFIEKQRIKVIKIKELSNLDEYSKFCINELYYMLPIWVEMCVTIQPDGFFLKYGWENFILSNKLDFIGPHWRHQANLDIKTKDGFRPFLFPPTQIGGGGFSFRRKSKMKLINMRFKNYEFKERGAEDGHLPEDCYYSVLGFGSNICKIPTLNECDKWATDPLDEKIYDDLKSGKKDFFGFHYMKKQSEWIECNHN